MVVLSGKQAYYTWMMNGVLIVEDEDSLRKAYTIVCRKNDWPVKSCTNGKQALELIKDTEYAVIILDVLMPVMGGLDFLEQYSRHYSHRKTKVLVMTNSMVPYETEQHALEMGATGYYHKNEIDVQKLKKLIEINLAKFKEES
jgi:CheY-like chemotaxis protein